MDELRDLRCAQGVLSGHLRCAAAEYRLGCPRYSTYFDWLTCHFSQVTQVEYGELVTERLRTGLYEWSTSSYSSPFLFCFEED